MSYYPYELDVEYNITQLVFYLKTSFGHVRNSMLINTNFF